MKYKIYVSLLIISSVLASGMCMSINANASQDQEKLKFEIKDLDKIEGVIESKNPKMESMLAQISNTYMINQTKAMSTASRHEVFMKDNMLKVIFYLTDNNSENIKRLEEYGVRIKKTKENRVYVYVPIYQLKIISELPFVNYIRRPWRAYPCVISEGVGVINADQLHDIGIRGDGVKVAILDGGFQGYQSKLGTELPGSVTVKSFREDGDITGGGEVHGTACAEIVHDVAPNAQLYLVNYQFEDEFEDAMNWLISQNVDVISHSCGFPIGPFDGTGNICDAVNDAKANGIMWVNAAGNYAERHYEGTYRDTNGDDWHEFSLTGDQEMSLGYISAYEPIGFHLSWDDWPYSDQDYDLHIVNSNFEIVAGSENPQTGTQPPAEKFVGYFTVSDYYYIVIHRYDATKNIHFELYSAFHDFSEHNVPSSSLGIPADAVGSLTVGATYWSNDVLESFSSRGPTNDGRTKPDVVAPDGVSTSTYGTHGFLGTSASAPHVSGAAALLLSYNSSLTVDEVQSLLESTALDLGASDKDNLYGSGRMDVWEAGLELDNPPYKPSSPFPSDGETAVSINADLSWTGGDPDGDTVTYDVYFEAGDSTPDVLVSSNQTGTTYDPGTLNYNTHYYWKIVATDKWGKSTTGDVWNFTTEKERTPPASITNLQNTTGNFWISWIWDNPPDPDFSHTMVYINASFQEDVTKPKNYYNATYLSHATKTISTQTVDENGNVNSTWINQTTTIPNNPPVLEAIGAKMVDECQILTIDANATDLDNDLLRYSCNRTDLFTDFSTTTGIGHWTPAHGQAGTYYVDFGVSDGYNGMDNESVKIIVVDKTPPIVTGATANPPTIFADGTHETLLNVTATDISGIKSVTVNLSAIGGSETQELQNNSGVWQCTANTTINGTFELPVNVTDNEGNSNTTATISLNAILKEADIIFTYRDSSLTTPADIFEDNATVFVVVTDGNTTGGNKAITVNNTYSESINVTVYDNGTNYDATADDKNYTGYFNIASGVTNDNTNELRLNEGDTATITANLANDSLAGTKTISRASKCFIATAAYGTSLHENIDILRSFRDKVLMQTSPGGALVTTYYSTSPPIADALAKNEGLRSAVRLLLLTPLVYFAEMILSGIGLIAIVFLGLGVFFGRRRYIKVVLKAIGLGLSTAVVLTGTVFALGWLAYTYPVCAVIAAYILPFIIPAAIGAGVMVLVLWKSKNHGIAQD